MSPSNRALLARYAPAAGVAAGACLVGALALRRRFLTFGVETDFLTMFVAQSKALLAGRPMKAGFHGPLFPVALAAMDSALRGWVRAGLAISWLAAVVAASTSFRLMDRLFGRWAAWGSLAGAFTSVAFLTFSASASSDLLFLALSSAAVLVAINERGLPSRWAAAGALVALALMTRTNGLPYLVLLLAPLCGAGSLRARMRGIGFTAAGFTLPILVWLAAARMLGTPALPQELHANLASTYFSDSGDRVSGDTIDRLRGRFTSPWDVIAEDPAHVAGVYAKDLASIVRNDLGTAALVAFPLHLLALPGLILLLVRGRGRWALLYGAALMLQTAFIALREYDPRFNLFLVPFLGACAGCCTEWLLRSAGSARLRAFAGMLVGALLLLGFREELLDAWTALHTQDGEIGEALPAASAAMEPGARLVARKPHLAFYTGSDETFFPDVDSLDELEAALREGTGAAPTYLYYGSAESFYRPALRSLAAGADPPGWLAPLVRSREPGAWSLYRVRLH